MKHIFTSRDNLMNARGRSIRKLEAQLDNEQDKLELKSSNCQMDNSNSSPANTLGENSISLNTLLLPTPQEPLLFCSYITNCNKACFQGTDKYNLCQIRKFKDRYKNFDYGRQMGI